MCVSLVEHFDSEVMRALLRALFLLSLTSRCYGSSSGKTCKVLDNTYGLSPTFCQVSQSPPADQQQWRPDNSSSLVQDPWDTEATKSNARVAEAATIATYHPSDLGSNPRLRRAERGGAGGAGGNWRHLAAAFGCDLAHDSHAFCVSIVMTVFQTALHTLLHPILSPTASSISCRMIHLTINYYLILLMVISMITF